MQVPRGPRQHWRKRRHPDWKGGEVRHSRAEQSALRATGDDGLMFSRRHAGSIFSLTPLDGRLSCNLPPLETQETQRFVSQNVHDEAEAAWQQPPRKGSVKAASFPLDPPSRSMVRRASVTLLPFQLRPLPLAPQAVEIDDDGFVSKKLSKQHDVGLITIKSMATPEISKSLPRARRQRKHGHALPPVRSGASTYANLWHDTGIGILLKKAQTFSLAQNRRIARRRLKNAFPSGFKRSRDQSTYYRTPAPQLAEIQKRI